MDGTRRSMSMITQEATITRVEKWETMNASISTRVSGGGGYIHNGTGHIDGINSTTTTNVQSQRNVRIYYEGSDGIEKTLTYSGGDLDVTEGSPIVIEWYSLEGFQEQVAGFFNKRNQSWYWLNSPETFISQWIGLSPDVRVKFWAWSSGVLVSAAMISFIITVNTNDRKPEFQTLFAVTFGLAFAAFFSLKPLLRWYGVRKTGLKNRYVDPDAYGLACSYVLGVANDGIAKKYRLS